MIDSLNAGKSTLAGRLTTASGAAPARPTPREASALPRLQRLAAQLAREPAPVNEARVAELRQALASGRYGVDPQAIAAALRNDDVRDA